MQVLIRQIKEEDNESLAKMIRYVFIEHNAPTKGTVYSDPTTD
ncbi:MAG: GNAT family N-acetyltransferase, partial [Bacteroidia bacterium]|nr:GNAT family N-acetyltransferase [Bacteroidia bacterium]